MAFKDMMMKVWRMMMCGEKDEGKHSLEIGSPTDVRRMDISDTMPGLSSDDKRMIREKASNDAIRLLSLQSHPPTQPPSPRSTSLPPSLPPSGLTTREPSQTLLNAASSNLPSNLPTPPRQKHNDASPPAFRMKSMWERTRRLSSGLSSHRSSSGYQELDTLNTGKGGEEEVLMLDLDLDFNDKSIHLDSPISVAESLKSVEGFDMQDTVGGTPSKKPLSGNPMVERALKDVEAVDSSDSDGEAVGASERKRLVKA
ncbi:hypothetical protein P280DRAFT_124865 [Massarina eburnea CBS 473.64]|uniref:Uncharacterized protein n=1 Tax=Massarina eburnea CBS 473.64 TaxID=1395130 RepID=A0A6A6SHA1_9PLEO|nr:hypothetical protein P280DRAFT_124865 [Massarina eburnea CBS 473.64]